MSHTELGDLGEDRGLVTEQWCQAIAGDRSRQSGPCSESLPRSRGLLGPCPGLADPRMDDCFAWLSALIRDQMPRVGWPATVERICRPARERTSLKLQKAIAIFRQEGIEPHVWIAPGHTFDSTTTHLLGMLGIRVISDGFWRWPHREKNGQFWIPQQLSDRIRPVPLGVWTVCYHVNKWTAAEVNRLSQDLATWHGQISSVPEIEEQFGECPGTWFRENFKSGLIRYYPMVLTLKLYEKLLPRFVRLGA